MQIILDSNEDTPESVRAYISAMFGDYETLTPAAPIEKTAAEIFQKCAGQMDAIEKGAPLSAGEAGNLVQFPLGNIPGPSSPMTAPAPASIPWDSRIHASTKAKNADGTFKRKRNVSDELVASVEAELMAIGRVAPAGANGATAPAMPPQMGMVNGIPTPLDQMTPPLPTGPAPTNLPPPMDMTPPPPIDNGIVDSFPALTRWVALRLNSPSNPTGKLQQNMIEHICRHFQLVDAKGHGSLQMVAHQPTYAAPIHAWLSQQIGEA